MATPREISPEERGLRLRDDGDRAVLVPPGTDDDGLVQVNVRLPRSLVAAADRRRKRLNPALSRDTWTAYVFEWALNQPEGTQVRVEPKPTPRRQRRR
jgi:hypothetical protein